MLFRSISHGLLLVTTLGFYAGYGAESAAQPPLTLDEAVTRTLQSSPGVEVQRQRILQAEFTEQIAAGQFDFALFSSVWSERSLQPQGRTINTASGPTDVVQQEATGMSVGAVQQLRNGITLTPSATVVRSSVNTNALTPDARSDVQLQIKIPLLRGWGSDAANVNELAAKSALISTKEFARHDVADRVARTTASYWSMRASVQTLKILQESEERALLLSQQLEDMVRVGEIEAAILQEANADLLRRRGDVVGANLSVEVNWQRLAAVMGLSPNEVGPPPPLSSEFPDVPPSFDWKQTTGLYFVNMALERRGDYRAVVQNKDTGDILLKKALNDLRPGLDLQLRAGYRGLTRNTAQLGLFNSLTENTAGPSGEIALEFDWPVANRSAKGEVGRRRSFVRENELSIQDLANGISAETRIAYATLKAAAAQYSVAQGTVAAFSTVVANIRRKVNTGEASITALVQNEDRAVQAQQALIGATRNFASALVELRRVTGTLVDEDTSEFQMQISHLVTLPPLPASTSQIDTP